MPGGEFEHKDKVFDTCHGGFKCHPIIRKISTNECENRVIEFLYKLGNTDGSIAENVPEKPEKVKQRRVYIRTKKYDDPQNYSIGRRTIFYPSTWHQIVISKIEDFNKENYR